MLVRFNSLGDVIKCTALPRLIKKQHPRVRLGFVTLSQHAPLLANNPHLDEVLCYPRQDNLKGLFQLTKQLRNRRPQLIIDLHNSLRSRFLRLGVNSHWIILNKHNWQRGLLSAWGWEMYSHYPSKQDDFLQLLYPWNIKDDGLGTEIYLGQLEQTQQFRSSFSAELKWLKNCRRPLLSVAPVAAWPLKCWPLAHVETLLKKFISQCNGSVMLFGGAHDEGSKELAAQLGRSAINLAGRTNFLESAWFASKSNLMVANDTGMSHIAEAVGVDTLVFFGPTTEHWGFFPQRASSRVLQCDLPCRPCTRNGKGRCHHPWQQACLASITPNNALQQICQMLNC